MTKYLVVAFLLLFASFDAGAQAMCGLTRWNESINASGVLTTYSTREAAQAACNSVASKTAYPDVSGWFYEVTKEGCTLNVESKNFTIKGNRSGTNLHPNCDQQHQTWSSGSYNTTGWYFNGDICPQGQTWHAGSQSCFSPEQCLSKPARTGGWYMGSSAMCHEGCEYDNPTDRRTETFGGKTYKSLGGSKPTGQPCSATEETTPLPDVPQYCQPVGTQTVCLKAATGEQCVSASTGRQVCWKPGETGEKPDQNTLQKRNAGPSEIPPSNLNLPSGDTLQKQGDSATTTSTHTVNNSTTTTTTTTTNYTTVNGTNAGGSNKGESGTGDGTGKEGDGEGDGSASGGGSCTEPPATTGDPVLGMIAKQSWETRCAVEKGNAANVTGDIGNCSQPFTVEGTNANAHQLRALRAQMCPQGEGPDPGDYSGEAGDPSGLFGEDNEIGADGLDMSGLGFGQSCPSLPTVSVMGRTIAFDTSVFCDWMHLGGVFVRILAALWCLRVIGGA